MSNNEFMLAPEAAVSATAAVDALFEEISELTEVEIAEVSGGDFCGVGCSCNY
jgi:hypothetical protein